MSAGVRVQPGDRMGVSQERDPGNLAPVPGKVPGLSDRRGLFVALKSARGSLQHPSSGRQLAAPSAPGRGNIYFYYKLRGTLLLSSPGPALQNISEIQRGVLIARSFLIRCQKEHGGAGGSQGRSPPQPLCLWTSRAVVQTTGRWGPALWLRPQDAQHRPRRPGWGPPGAGPRAPPGRPWGP